MDLSGLFPLRLETNEAVAGMLLETRIYNLGDDWVSRYRSRLREVTAEQVRHAAEKYFDPEGFTYALVGNASAIAKQLRDFARIRVLRISDLQ
jgi:zinc protease